MIPAQNNLAGITDMGAYVEAQIEIMNNKKRAAFPAYGTAPKAN